MKVHEDGFIQYDGNIYIIELTDQPEAEKFAIQYGGIFCYQYNNSGIPCYEFKSNSKFLNPNWWYMLHWLSSTKVKDKNDKIYTKRDILVEILKLVEKYTKLVIPIENISSFEEALIEFRINDNFYIITWNNCD